MLLLLSNHTSPSDDLENNTSRGFGEMHVKRSLSWNTHLFMCRWISKTRAHRFKRKTMTRESTNADDQRLPHRHEQAGGNPDADDTLSETPESVEHKATEDSALTTFWSIVSDYVYRRKFALRGQLHVPFESSFPIPLKYIDVHRQTETNVDNLEEGSASNDAK